MVASGACFSLFQYRRCEAVSLSTHPRMSSGARLHIRRNTHSLPRISPLLPSSSSSMSPSTSPTRRSRGGWSAPSRREWIFVAVLFTILVFIFQSDLSFRFRADASTWDLVNNYEETTYDSKRPPKIIPSIEVSESNGLTMNDVRIEWGAKIPMPQTTLVQHTQGALEALSLSEVVWACRIRI